MAKHPVTLGSLTFDSKKDAAIHIIQILDLNINQTIGGEDLEVILSLLEHHPNYEEKVGSGIKRIFVEQKSSTYGTNVKPWRCFYIERFDASVVDFSYDNCLKNYPQGLNNSSATLSDENRQQAYRIAVDDQIIAFKQQHQDRGCAECGSRVALQVDHFISFVDLLHKFEANESELPTQFDDDEFHRKRFRQEDADFANRWQEFHKQSAQLRILCGECNRRRKGRKRYRGSNRT